jgi:hypothetical protein
MSDSRDIKGRRWLGGGLLLAFALAAGGCGPSGAVSGKVSFKGAPVKGGTVTFFGPGNWTGTSSIEEDGSYQIDKPPRGPMRIAVETNTVRPNVPRGMPMGPPKGTPVPEGFEQSIYNRKGKADLYVAIPDRYGEPDTSGLTCEVTGGKQTHNIDLQ